VFAETLTGNVLFSASTSTVPISRWACNDPAAASANNSNESLSNFFMIKSGKMDDAFGDEGDFYLLTRSA
jgi:hypothetical protein